MYWNQETENKPNPAAIKISAPRQYFTLGMSSLSSFRTTNIYWCVELCFKCSIDPFFCPPFPLMCTAINKLSNANIFESLWIVWSVPRNDADKNAKKWHQAVRFVSNSWSPDDPHGAAPECFVWNILASSNQIWNLSLLQQSRESIETGKLSSLGMNLSAEFSSTISEVWGKYAIEAMQPLLFTTTIICFFYSSLRVPVPVPEYFWNSSITPRICRVK